MHRNEQGLTLLEVLATVIILSIIGIVIWNVFIQGYQFSNKSIKKSQMQQEANYVLTSMKRFHQNSDVPYYINVSGCEITVSNKPEGSDSIVFNHPQICFSSNFTGRKDVNPERENVNFIIIATDENDNRNKLSIETVLYRLKSGE